MKRILYLLVCLCTGSLQLRAQAPQTSLLWEIRGKGLQHSSYLFGTFHIMCKAEFSISQELKSRITGSRYFYGELNMDELGNDTKVAMKLMMTDKSLKDLIGKKDYPAVSDGFQKVTGISLEMLDHFKPFMAESLLAMNMISCTDRVQPETEFANIAKENKVPMRGLETIDDQLNAVDKQPLDSQVHSLAETVLKFDSSKLMMAKMIAVYRTRDVDSLYAFLKANGSTGDFEKELLVNRNHNWVPLIEKAMTDGPVFFAVGAGHLGGPDGIIRLLRKRGYKLTPVKY